MAPSFLGTLDSLRLTFTPVARTKARPSGTAVPGTLPQHTAAAARPDRAETAFGKWSLNVQNGKGT